MIKSYRKSEIIQAEQFDGSDEMINKYGLTSLEDDQEEIGIPYNEEFWILTSIGTLSMYTDDWIATGVNGEHWPIADDVFKKTYEELPVISNELDSYIQLYKRNGYGIIDMLYDLNDEVCPDVHLTKDDIARAWLDGYRIEGAK